MTGFSSLVIQVQLRYSDQPMQPPFSPIAAAYHPDANKALVWVHWNGHAVVGPKQDCEKVLHGMRVLKLICAKLLGKAWRFPYSAPAALREGRPQFARRLLEAERLDRIRNPSKYLGRP
jgi:hypothetical protein